MYLVFVTDESFAQHICVLNLVKKCGVQILYSITTIINDKYQEFFRFLCVSSSYSAPNRSYQKVSEYILDTLTSI